MANKKTAKTKTKRKVSTRNKEAKIARSYRECVKEDALSILLLLEDMESILIRHAATDVKTSLMLSNVRNAKFFIQKSLE